MKIEAKFILKGDKLFRKDRRYSIEIQKGRYDDIYVSRPDGIGKAYPTILEFLGEWSNIKIDA